jgi:uncharacterized protein YdeI (YjbR/CyaY-like superfamily)
MKPADRPVHMFASRRDFDQWLVEHHALNDGIWLKLAKKASKIKSVSYSEALEVALCHGWIDGQKYPLDDSFWLQRFTPRRARSKWSKRNCAIALQLLAQGDMQPAGLREIESARADGRWEAAYDGQRTAKVPEDLAQALAENEAAQVFFASLDSANRYAVLYRIHEARRPDTRARRIEQFVAMLADHQKLHP